MSKEYDCYAHSFVTVKLPAATDDGTDADAVLLAIDRAMMWRHPLEIVLHTGAFVWIGGDYSMVGIEGIVQVGDARSNGYDRDGNCILSIPAEWCSYYTEEEANNIAELISIDDQLLRYAIG
jgi:hypothetical protein